MWEENNYVSDITGVPSDVGFEFDRAFPGSPRCYAPKVTPNAWYQVQLMEHLKAALINYLLNCPSPIPEFSHIFPLQLSSV